MKSSNIFPRHTNYDLPNAVRGEGCYIIDKNEVIHIPKKSKEELASNILQHIYKLENKKGNSHEHIN